MGAHWWVVKHDDQYLMVDGFSSSQRDAHQYTARPTDVPEGCRIVRIRARVPARGLDFETALGNSKARSV